MPQSIDANKIIRRISVNPKQSIADAKKSNATELMGLSNFWHELGPVMLDLGVLDAFFANLDGTKVPEYHVSRSSFVDAAFMSLLGVSKSGNFIGDGEKYVDQFIRAWPGLFKWSVYFFASRVEEIRPGINAEQRKSASDVISAAWYSVSRNNRVRDVMVATPDSIEIATKLWLVDDVGSKLSGFGIPTGTAALSKLLGKADEETTNRMLYAAGGEADKIAKLAISRLRSAMQENPIQPSKASIHTDLINEISRGTHHPLRHALLSANVIQVVTKCAVAVTAQLNLAQDSSLVDPMFSCFQYLANCLQSTDGFTWVVQSVQAGLLTAFVDGSPHFYKLPDPGERFMILSIFKDILPRYLVYQSVIEAVHNAMPAVVRDPRLQRIQTSIAKDVWRDFYKLALERLYVKEQGNALKGKAATCDNVKCQKIDSKNNFRQCAACLTTFYCSRECQREAWKEGDHKKMCKLKQQERVEGKLDPVSKQDTAFFHHLSSRDARRHLPQLRSLAARDFENLQLSDLIICIDYTQVPETYSLKQLTDTPGPYSRPTAGSENAEARNKALFTKAREHPGKYTLIESLISQGRTNSVVVTLLIGKFWDGDTGLIGSDVKIEEEKDWDGGAVVDEVDLMMARNALNDLLRSMGQPATF